MIFKLMFQSILNSEVKLEGARMGVLLVSMVCPFMVIFQGLVRRLLDLVLLYSKNGNEHL